MSAICRESTVATDTAGGAMAAVGVAVSPRLQPASCTSMANAKTTAANQMEMEWRFIPDSPYSLTHWRNSQPVLMGDISVPGRKVNIHLMPSGRSQG